MIEESARLLITIVIGVVASIAFNQYARRSFPTQVGPRFDRTSSLVGIAGAFIGLHIGAVIGLTPWPVALYLAALVGALATMWCWHGWM